MSLCWRRPKCRFFVDLDVSITGPVTFKPHASLRVDRNFTLATTPSWNVESPSVIFIKHFDLDVPAHFTSTNASAGSYHFTVADDFVCNNGAVKKFYATQNLFFYNLLS